LYLTKKIIENSGGTINAKSEFGKGTKFIFTLPLG
jgi:signal transduction histidine kinase